MKNHVIKSFLLLSLLAIGCTKYNKNDILLMAGKYKFKVSDYIMFNSRTDKQVIDSEREENLINNSYIMAFALDQRYDTIKYLSKKTFYGMRLYASEENGWIWNRKVKPHMKVTNEDIKNAYNKRNVEYTVEYIGFQNGIGMDKSITSFFKIKTESEFNTIKQRVASNPEVTKGNFKSFYPFYPLSSYIDKFCKSHTGDVLGPFETPSNIYMLHITDIRKVKQPDFNRIKPLIERDLLNSIVEKNIQDSQKDIIRKANPQMNDKAILLIAANFANKTKQWSGIDDNMVLMTYQFNCKKHSFKTSDFKELLHFRPVIMGSLSKTNDLKDMMKNFLMDIYLYEEALNLKAEDDEEFIAFKRHYQYKLFVQYYKKLYIYPKVKIVPDEVKKYYDENKTILTGFESAAVIFFKFRDQQSAYNGLNLIQNFYRPNYQNPASSELHPSNIPGMISVTEKNVVNLSDTTNNINLINAICAANEGQTLMPLKINGEFYVVHLKNKTGFAPLPFRYVKGKCEKMLSEKKLQDAMDHQITGLKAKYPLTINRLKEYIQKKGK